MIDISGISYVAGDFGANVWVPEMCSMFALGSEFGVVMLVVLFEVHRFGFGRN